MSLVPRLARTLSLICVVVSASKLSKKTSRVEEMIASLREKTRANQESENSALVGNEEAPRPFTEKNAGEPCRMRGLVVRREMGDLGVTSFQVAIQEMIRDALGPSWETFDDWPRMAQYLRVKKESRWVGSVTQEEADKMRKACRRKVTINPFGQEPLGLTPLNITDGSWVKATREMVCGAEAPWNQRKASPPSDNSAASECVVVKVQGHWQHAGYFYRYRQFLTDHVFRAANDLRDEFVLNLEAPNDRIRPEFTGKVADLVVYLRLGDKSVAGDTILTFDSGYFEAVLDKIRSKHNTCWIITQTPSERRAKALASSYNCVLVSSPKQYTDWTLMFTAPKTLVMAASTFVYFQGLLGWATQVHYPAVGFFHDKHNVCMREKNPSSHFAHIRLPISDPKMVYHDVYSRNWFLTYDELAAESAALPCRTILDQHVCDLTKNKYQFGAEGRYCYRAQNATSLAAQKEAQERSHRAGAEAVQLFRRKHAAKLQR